MLEDLTIIQMMEELINIGHKKEEVIKMSEKEVVDLHFQEFSDEK
jgi:hypothetical protein